MQFDHAAGNADAAALAATAYRGLLLALPASTALWFGDLRDRGTAAAVESYTRAEHSPVLLAHELAIIQVGGASRQAVSNWRQCSSAEVLPAKHHITLHHHLADAAGGFHQCLTGLICSCSPGVWLLQSPAARELADADAFSLKANPAMREVVAVAQVRLLHILAGTCIMAS